VITCESQPVLDVDVGLRVGDVVDGEDAPGALVVDLAERLEAFLAGSVPEGDLDVLAPDAHRLRKELDAYRGAEVLVELALDVLRSDVGLACARVADQNYLV
jgi:hypothetical protein